jgi:hypothetical protein
VEIYARVEGEDGGSIHVVLNRDADSGDLIASVTVTPADDGPEEFRAPVDWVDPPDPVPA